MYFNPLFATVFLSTFCTALPLDSAPRLHDLAPRAKSYAIVNVDGGSSTAPPAAATTTKVEDRTKTKTIKVTDTAPTVTDTVTATVEPTSTPTPSASYASSSPEQPPKSTPTPSPSAQPIETPSASIVIVVITETASPSEYYDNGMWHTSYAVKTFEAVAVTSSLPTLQPTARSYNETRV